MTMVVRQIVGYDPITERVVFECNIDDDKWYRVTHIVKNNEDDPDYVYNYPLETSSVNDIMSLLGRKAVMDLNYFLESEAVV